MKVIQSVIGKAMGMLWCLLPAVAVAAGPDSGQPLKIKHAEPLFYDLVRDLGARKGEKEFNIGADFKNASTFKEHALLAEFEFAPIHRLGLEAEADISLYTASRSQEKHPGNRLESIRLSGQYSFWVSSRYRGTMALGYTQILELTDFRNYGKGGLLTGAIGSPFFVVAKRWKANWHSLLYVSPLISYTVGEKGHAAWMVNVAVHYTLPHTGHFIGVEMNTETDHGYCKVTLRPQIKLKLHPRLAAGFVAGVPLAAQEEGFSSFIRLIYEL